MSRNVVIAGEAGFAFAGFLFGQAARFGFNLVVGRLFGAEVLGNYALVIALIQIAEVVALAGMDVGLLRYLNLYAADHQRQRTVIATSMGIGLLFSSIAALLLLFGSGMIATMVGGTARFQMMLCSYAAALPFSVTMLVSGHAVQGFSRLRPKIMATQIFSPLLLLLLTALLKLLFNTELALYLPFFLSVMFSACWLFLKLGAVTPFRFRDMFRLHPDRSFVSFSFSFMLVSVLAMLGHWLDILMLGMMTDPVTVGLYHPAARTAGLLRAVLLAFSGIVAPKLAALHAKQEYGEMQAIYRMVTRWIFILVMPVTSFLLVFPVEILSLFGARFALGTVHALRFLVLASSLQALFGLSSTLLSMTGHGRLSLYNSAGSILVQILLNLLLIPVAGLDGAAYAMFMLVLLFIVVRLMQTWRLLQLHPFSKGLWKPVFAIAVVTLFLPVFDPLAALFAPPLHLVANALFLGCAYLLTLSLLGIEPDDRALFLGFFHHKRLPES